MRTILVLLGLTVALVCALKFVVTPNFGEDVEARFIERLKDIPSQSPARLTTETLNNWLENPANRNAIRGYVCPVLFPLDIAFLICLGWLLGAGSVALAERSSLLSAIPVWIWWLFPALYIAFDLAEDTTLIGIFTSFLPITDRSYNVLRTFTVVKITTVSLAFAQVGLLALVSLVLKFLPKGSATG